MDSRQISVVLDVLRPTGWWERARAIGSVLRLTSARGDLLLLGTPDDEPWHLAAHLSDQARHTGLSQLHPTLVRWAPPAGAPAHLSVGLDRLHDAGRGQTVLVISPDAAPDELLERVDDVRRAGATVLSIDTGDEHLGEIAHERMSVGPSGLVLPDRLARGRSLLATAEPIELAQHLVSTASGAASATRPGWRRRLGQLR